jgi:hypothetical protein
MCYGEKQGHHAGPVAGPMHHGAHHSGGHGMHGTCGCEEKQGHHSGAHGMCGCGGRRFLSKKERVEMLEEYRESLKCELEGVEEELKRLQVE